MITNKVRIQLIAFVTMGTIAAALIFFHYARIPTLMGFGQTQVRVDFAKGAGLYPNANVTYRGVTVGTVAGMDIAGDHITADLSIDSSAHVPEDVTASIKSVSAIGEQYVDLVPKAGARSTALADGSHIKLADTHVPIQIAQVLDNVDTLLTSVPAGSLATVLDEADKGFNGLGPDLAQLNRDAQALIADADTNYEATHQLIVDANPVLGTQISTSPQIRSWASDLAGFSTALRKSDKQVRGLLTSVPPAAQSVTGLLNDLSKDAPALIRTADVSATLAKAYYPAIEQVLTVYPLVAAADIASDAPDRGNQFRLSFKAIANYPGGCSDGWPKAGQPYGYRPSTVLSDAISAPNAYCRIKQSDPRVVRGARNLQCFEPGSTKGERAALITQCRRGGYTENAPPFTTILVNDPLAPFGSSLLGSFNPGDPGRTASRATSWQGLLMGQTS
ncbi:MAG: hypothetical protein JWR83_2627 [Aeromicrobium sp.]|nr:hypothetical protein [Aeromicrobium sp.]